MRTLLLLVVLLAAPLAVGEENRAAIATDILADDDPLIDLGPDPPPGRPCRPHCLE